jgi:serine/alanine adding enzyme
MIRTLDPMADADWECYVARHPGYTIYHGAAFHRAVREAFGKPAYGLAALDEAGRIVGVLPLIRQTSRLFGDRLVSLPYANHGGPLADSPNIAQRLFSAAIELGETLGCNRIEIRDHEARELDWPVRTDKVLMTMVLPVDTAMLDKALGAKLRSQCRRALKEGARVRHGGAELIPEFYRVFAANMRDLGTPVYPRRWFEILVGYLGEAMRLLVVTLHEQPTAACVLLRWNATLEIPWAASVRAFNPYAVNMLLYREALGVAIDGGCTAIDFGRSTRGSGPWHFKRQWGAKERQIYWRVRPALADQGRWSEALRRTWSRLPLPVANRFGPMISAELPW